MLRGEVRWGSWSYDPYTFSLNYAADYQIDLLLFGTAADALYYINHVAEKGRFTDADIGSLVRAIHELRANATGPMWRTLPEKELIVPLVPLRDRRTNSRSGVYAMRAGDAVKIGRAVDIDKRFKELQTGNHERLELAGILSDRSDDEGAWHAKFQHLRKQGEWFTLGEQIAVHVRDANLRRAAAAER